MGMIGVWGAVISGIQMMALEWESLSSVNFRGMISCHAMLCGMCQLCHVSYVMSCLCLMYHFVYIDGEILSYMFGFSLCLFLLYTLTPILIQHSSAIFLNLSFLTSDFWSILVAVSQHVMSYHIVLLPCHTISCWHARCCIFHVIRYLCFTLPYMLSISWHLLSSSSVSCYIT